MRNTLWLLAFCSLCVGCGVRGDPIPPGYPVELGRGRPSFKDPAQTLPSTPLPSAQELEERAKEEEEEDE